MKYLLDTDHLSILQRQKGKDFSSLSARMNCYPLSDFAVSTVTFHEQMLGCHAYINPARNINDVVKGYEIMTKLLNDFKIIPLLSFDTKSAEIFNQLYAQRIQLAKMDARIAAIAISNDLVLLTRNHQDFGKVPGLLLEDWTVE
ncbi:MAG: type II toxin-antitoxin system VapC family toxin [Dolichospermum sp.]